MTPTLFADAPEVRAATSRPGQGAKNVYYSLYADPSASTEEAKAFVADHIAIARELQSEVDILTRCSHAHLLPLRSHRQQARVQNSD